MKRLCAAWMILISLAGHGQRSIPSYTVSVTFRKTTNIIFPYRIEKADVGSSDVIGHKDEILKNVLFLKANRKDFAPTNLSVYTSDGKFYSFIVSYKEDPDTLNLSFSGDSLTDNRIVDAFMDSRLDSSSVNILQQAPFLHRKSKSQNIKVILKGIYLQDDIMWFTMLVKNRSEINYKPAFIQFTVRDKKTGKRTAVQESELTLRWSNIKNPVPGRAHVIYVFAFPSFTVPQEKKLVFHIEEKHGERSVDLDISSRTVLKAKLLP